MTRVLALVTGLAGGVATAFAALPITFELNRGQEPPDVAFLSRTSGYRVFLTRSGAVIRLEDGFSVRMRLRGARETTPVGTEQIAARTNYLLGPDPARWRSHIENYKGVTYPHVYPGIDLVWHAHNDQIEHDFLVAAGADPRLIDLSFSGAALRLTPEGDLMAGGLRYQKPHAYQDGREVDCSYGLHGRSVTFVLGWYDHQRPLTIDPVLSFSTYFGTGAPAATALDGAGNLYIVGTTSALGFPGTPGTIQPMPVGDSCSIGGPFSPPVIEQCTDIFIAKLSGDGQTLLYATYLGGPKNDSATAVAVGPGGNLYIAGQAGTPSAFPKLTPLPGQGLLPGFVAELSADGSSLIYATSLPAGIVASGLAVDASGSVYVTGTIIGGLPTVNAFQSAPTDAYFLLTVDQGAHWRGIGPDILSSGLSSSNFLTIAADPSNPQIIYAITQEFQVYKSTDSGGHWTSIQNGIADSALSIAVDPHAPQTLYVGVIGASSGFTVYKSTDGGASWTGSAGAGKYAIAMAVDPTNPSIVYAGAMSRLYKSTDGGVSWNATGLTNIDPNQVVIDPANSSTIYVATMSLPVKSTDGGVTWSVMANGFVPNSSVTSIALDPSNPQTLYAGTGFPNQGVYKSSDGGASWTRSLLPARFGPVRFVMVDRALPSRVWAATDNGVAISQDSGASWSATNLPHFSVPALASEPAGGVYAVHSGPPPGDAFVMKLDATGSQIVYSTYLGGIGYDVPGGIAVDAAGRAYVAGETDSPDFPLAAPLQGSFGGNSDVFVTVLDPTGSQLVWSTYLGGSEAEGAKGIALDLSGNVHLAGATMPNNAFVATTTEPPNYFHERGADVFAAKIKSDGSALIYSVRFGGSDYDSARGVAADTAGNTYIAGVTFSKDLPTLNAVQTTLAGFCNVLVAEFDGRTGAVQYATYLGGNGSDYAVGVAADARGNVYLTGVTASTDFPLENPWRSGAGTMFVTKLSSQNPSGRPPHHLIRRGMLPALRAAP